MSVPVILAIVTSIQTALQGITTAGGYFYDIQPSSVVLDARALNTIPATEIPFLVVGHRVEPMHREYGRSGRGGGRFGAIEDRWRITIEARVDANGLDTFKKMTALAELEADIEKALVVDPRRGGLALFTYPMPANRFTGLANQNMCFLEFPAEVLLARNLGEP